MQVQLTQTLVQLMVPTLVSDQNLSWRVLLQLKFVLLSELGKIENWDEGVGLQLS